MNTSKYILITLLFISSSLFAQTHYIPAHDTSMVSADNCCNLKVNGYPEDGRYVVLQEFPDTTRKIYDATLVKGELNGSAVCYYDDGVTKRKETNYVMGEKNGTETRWNKKGIFESAVTYQHNELNGPITVYYKKTSYVKGWLSNGLKDSIWSVWHLLPFQSISDVNVRPDEVYRYINGVAYLINAHDFIDSTHIENGNGVMVKDGFGSTTIINYLNGLPFGEEMEFDVITNNKIHSVWYADGFPVARASYNEHQDTIYYYEVECLGVEVDTFKGQCGVDDYRLLKTQSWPYLSYNGRYFNAINKVYLIEGTYEHGEKIGLWRWRYEDGTIRMEGDYDSNDWKYYDRQGQLINIDFKGEFLTRFKDRQWFIASELSSDTILLTPTLPEKMLHQNILTLQLNDSWELQQYLFDDERRLVADQSVSIASIDLIADKITFHFITNINQNDINDTYSRTYRITQQQDGSLVLITDR